MSGQQSFVLGRHSNHSSVTHGGKPFTVIPNGVLAFGIPQHPLDRATCLHTSILHSNLFAIGEGNQDAECEGQGIIDAKGPITHPVETHPHQTLCIVDEPMRLPLSIRPSQPESPRTFSLSGQGLPTASPQMLASTASVCPGALRFPASTAPFVGVQVLPPQSPKPIARPGYKQCLQGRRVRSLT